MILVDDASTDDSFKICKEYSSTSGHIQTIHLDKNQGLSATRNVGVRKAKGEYITFVDSDDYLAEGTLKGLMETLAIHPDYDFLEYPVYEHYGSKEQRILEFYKTEYTDMAEYWLVGKAYSHTYTWNKIYRRELFNGIDFPNGKTFEDVWILPKLLKHCHLVATTSVGMYYYCDNPKGITRNTKTEDLKSLLNAHLAVMRELHPTPTRKNFNERLTNDFANYYAAVFNILLDVSDNSHEIPAFPILPYKNTFKLRLLHIIGLKLTCQLHRIFHRSH